MKALPQILTVSILAVLVSWNSQGLAQTASSSESSEESKSTRQTVDSSAVDSSSDPSETVPSAQAEAVSSEAGQSSSGSGNLAAEDEELWAGPNPSLVPVEVPALPKPVSDVVQLAQRSMGEGVLSHYINSVQTPFELNTEQLIYLADLGIPDTIVAQLMTRSSELAEQHGLPAPSVASVPALQHPDPGTPPANGPQQYQGQFQPSQQAAPVYGAAQAGPPPEEGQPTAQVAPPSNQVTYNVFYESLSPYGNWVQLPELGWVWQPTVSSVNPDWRPYGDGGRWFWSDYGWYWHSYYSWGWAPFHYGRWHWGNPGWFWVPGRVWAPAWVAWRHDAAFCGWAALPPYCTWAPGVGFAWTNGRVGFGIGLGAWSIAPWGNFCDPFVYRAFLPGHRAQQFVNNTSIQVGDGQSVNIVGNNNRVIINNNVVSREMVESRGRQEVRKVDITDARSPVDSARNSRLAATGNSERPQIAAFRPEIRPAASGDRPAPSGTVLARQEERKTSGYVRPQTALATGRPAGNLTGRPSGYSQTPGASVRPMPSGAVSAQPAPSATRPGGVSSAGRPAEGTSAVRPGTSVSSGTTSPSGVPTRPGVSGTGTTSTTRPGATAPYPGGSQSTVVTRPGSTPATQTPSTRPGATPYPSNQQYGTQTPAQRPAGTAGTTRPTTPVPGAVRPAPAVQYPTQPSVPSQVRPGVPAQPQPQNTRPATVPYNNMPAARPNQVPQQYSAPNTQTGPTIIRPGGVVQRGTTRYPGQNFGAQQYAPRPSTGYSTPQAAGSRPNYNVPSAARSSSGSPGVITPQYSAPSSGGLRSYRPPSTSRPSTPSVSRPSYSAPSGGSISRPSSGGGSSAPASRPSSSASRPSAR